MMLQDNFYVGRGLVRLHAPGTGRPTTRSRVQARLAASLSLWRTSTFRTGLPQPHPLLALPSVQLPVPGVSAGLHAQTWLLYNIICCQHPALSCLSTADDINLPVPQCPQTTVRVRCRLVTHPSNTQESLKQRRRRRRRLLRRPHPAHSRDYLCVQALRRVRCCPQRSRALSETKPSVKRQAPFPLYLSVPAAVLVPSQVHADMCTKIQATNYPLIPPSLSWSWTFRLGKGGRNDWSKRENSPRTEPPCESFVAFSVLLIFFRSDAAPRHTSMTNATRTTSLTLALPLVGGSWVLLFPRPSPSATPASVSPSCMALQSSE